MYHLVTQSTALALEDVKRQIEEHNLWLGRYDLNYRYYDERIHSAISQVTGQLFAVPENIRAWFKANKTEFCGHTDPKWNEWLNKPEDSNMELLSANGFYRFFYMSEEEYSKMLLKRYDSSNRHYHRV